MTGSPPTGGRKLTLSYETVTWDQGPGLDEDSSAFRRRRVNCSLSLENFWRQYLQATSQSRTEDKSSDSSSNPDPFSRTKLNTFHSGDSNILIRHFYVAP